MVEHFHSFRGRLRRRFGGLPVYIGHPDDPQFRQQPGHQDTRAYAWIQDMDARDDGLCVLTKWSEAGLRLLRNAFFKFLSPRWEMQSLEPGKFRPVRLLSVGLTNYPNIPGDAIANQTAEPAEATTVQSQAVAMALPPAMTGPQPAKNSQNIPPSPPEEVRANNPLPADANPNEGLEDFLARGLGEGHILPNECAVWACRYGEDPIRAVEEMQILRHGLHRQAHSARLHETNPQSSSREQLLSQVRRRIRSFGESYTDAWAAVRQSHPHLF